MFVTLEGCTGAGKTTLSRNLTQALSATGIPVRATREPGGTPYGEAIRQLIVNHDLPTELDTHLYLEMKRDHEENLILPALQAGITVVSDRFTGAFLAYRCFKKGVSLELLEQMLQQHTPCTKPDITLFLDIEPEVGLRRKEKQGEVSWFDTDLEAEARHRDGYHFLANRYGWITAPSGLNEKELLNFALGVIERQDREAS